jgi:pimeloyl-ACP methyl ester carboxylesterase
MANPIFCMFMRPFMQKTNAKKLMDNNNDLNEGRYVNINGIEQWITIRGQNKSNPVILFVHGGPGSTYTPFNVYLLEWEKYFTIVQWDQNGSGKTFKKNGVVENLSFDTLANDGIEVSKYICSYLNCKKIILIGSSAGSLIGLKMIKKSSALFFAYVGAEQNSPDTGLFYRILKDYAKKHDKKAFMFLEKIGNDKKTWTKKDTEKVNKIAIKVDKNAPNMVFDLMLPALMYDQDLTMKDIQLLSKGMDYALEKLYREMINFNFDDVGYQFKIPLFIFQGEYDIITPVEDAVKYFEKIEAPHKEFILIKNAGHLAEFANPKQFLEELKNKVLPLIKQEPPCRPWHSAS